MNIIVCIKQVPDTNLQIRLNKEGSDIDRENLSYVMSPYDEFAVEEAIRIKEKFPDSVSTAVTLGPESADEIIRQALAMGIDEGIHIIDSNSKIREGLISAQALSEVIAPIKPDIILCGRQAVDDDGFQVGGALAQMLGFPEICVANKISVGQSAGQPVTIERILEGGIRQTVEAGLPCVITCQKGINEPRYPSLPGIMKAKKKSVKQIKVEELKVNMLSRFQVEKLEIPQSERKMLLIEKDAQTSARELVGLLRENAKVI